MKHLCRLLLKFLPLTLNETAQSYIGYDNSTHSYVRKHKKENADSINHTLHERKKVAIIIPRPESSPAFFTRD